MDQPEIERLYQQAIQAVQQCEMETSDHFMRRYIHYALSLLIQGLADEKAHNIAVYYSCKLTAAANANEGLLVGGFGWPVDGRGPEILDGFLTEATPSVRRDRARATVTAIGLACGGPLPALTALPAACEPLPCRLSTPELVELLKMPTCFGPARQVVLKHLGNRYGRTFANHWEFVRFAQENHLGLDFTSPPKRPARP